MPSFITALSAGALLALFFSFAAAVAQQPAPAADNKDLVGQWEGFVMAGDGTSTGQRRVNISLIITPDKITCRDTGNAGEGDYRISSGAGNVRNIDATGTAGFYKDHIYQGIITIEGNTLKWCSNSGEPREGRPKEFRSINSAHYFLAVLTRKP